MCQLVHNLVAQTRGWCFVDRLRSNGVETPYISVQESEGNMKLMSTQVGHRRFKIEVPSRLCLTYGTAELHPHIGSAAMLLQVCLSIELRVAALR